MLGEIYLVRIEKNRVVPVICLVYKKDLEEMHTAQIRKANQVDLFNTYDIRTRMKLNRERSEKDQIRNPKKYEIDTVFIGSPKGLKSESVVMVSKAHLIRPNQIIRKLSQVSEKLVKACLALQVEVNHINKLKKELGMLKKKIQLAKMNNERYSDLEKRFEQIRDEIGYPEYKDSDPSGYLNYREVPNKGYIRIFFGGR